jgi:hypothetical protein
VAVVADDSSTRVLVIGLDPYRVPGPWDPKPVADAIEAGMTALADRGFDAETCLVGLDGSDDIPARVAAALRARPWACVIVGGGLRKPGPRPGDEDEQLALFEAVVNLVHRLAPQAAIAFNSTPGDLADVVARSLQAGQESRSSSPAPAPRFGGEPDGPTDRET